MQVVPLGPKRVKLSEFNDCKKWKDVQHKVNNQREGIQKRKIFNIK